MLQVIDNQDQAANQTTLTINESARQLVVREIQNIEAIEDGIADMRADIKRCVERMVAVGLNKKAIKIALSRRKLEKLHPGELFDMDESVSVICSIPALGVQGELFVPETLN